MKFVTLSNTPKSEEEVQYLDSYKKYCDSHRTPGDPSSKIFMERLDSVKPIKFNLTNFVEEMKTNKEFAKKWKI